MTSNTSDSLPSPLFPAHAGIQRKKTAEGRQNLFPVWPGATAFEADGLRPESLRWKPASAGMSGGGS